MKDTDNIFSPLETKVIVALGKRHHSTSELIDKVYGSHPPLFARNAITNAVRFINEKCEYHQYDWFINGSGSGRGGKTMWVETHRKKV